MKITRLFALLLVFDILFSNTAWALDDCRLTDDISSQMLIQLDLEPDNIVYSDDEDTTNSCDTYCYGWSHLNYIASPTVTINISKSHTDVIPRPFIYHFSLNKPPIEPPIV